FRDYLYIPLGGNRHGAARTYRNLVIVFLLCGLWHGAGWTFVLGRSWSSSARALGGFWRVRRRPWPWPIR
ncbi:MAG: MBOAT family O-acyltransferase, partial [Beijerinckiaceae bacterium]